MSDVDSIRFEVVVLSAVIWSRTSFWSASAWATMTAVRSAEIVVVVARWTPLMSSMLLRRMTSRARYPWTLTASWVRRSWFFWRTEKSMSSLRTLARSGSVASIDAIRADSAVSRLWARYEYWRRRPMTAHRLTFSCSIEALSRWSSSCP